MGKDEGLANSLGLLLQKTNIIRDYLEDIRKGREFWPKEVCVCLHVCAVCVCFEGGIQSVVSYVVACFFAVYKQSLVCLQV